MLEGDCAVGPDGFVGELHECTVVKDVAVLVDLDERRTFVMRCAVEGRQKVLDVDIE